MFLNLPSNALIFSSNIFRRRIIYRGLRSSDRLFLTAYTHQMHRLIKRLGCGGLSLSNQSEVYRAMNKTLKLIDSFWTAELVHDSRKTGRISIEIDDERLRMGQTNSPWKIKLSICGDPLLSNVANSDCLKYNNFWTNLFLPVAKYFLLGVEIHLQNFLKILKFKNVSRFEGMKFNIGFSIKKSAVVFQKIAKIEFNQKHRFECENLMFLA